MTKQALTAAALLAATSATAGAGGFRIGFDWGDIPLCTTGHPGRVPSPVFVLENVPEGTDSVAFELHDLDAPWFEHGGGIVPVSGDGVIPPGPSPICSPARRAWSTPMNGWRRRWPTARRCPPPPPGRATPSRGARPKRRHFPASFSSRIFARSS